MQFPTLQSAGMNHPPTEQNAMISRLIGYAQMVGFGVLFFGSVLFSSILKMEEPPLVKWMTTNKMNAFCAIFMLGFVSTQLLATGAFEVYYNGQLVYSKLDSGRIPHIQDIVGTLQMLGVQASPAKF